LKGLVITGSCGDAGYSIYGLEASLALISPRRNFGVAIILLTCLALFGPSRGWCGLVRLAIMPPAIHAGQDMSFLEKGVVDMLVGRATVAGLSEAVPVASEDRALDLSAAVAKGKAASADYVVVTSITVLGSSVSTDAKVLETATGSIALTFSQAGEEQADIITHIDRLADRITAHLSGRPPAAPTPTDVQPPSPPPADAAGPAAIHQHPEKLLRDLDSDTQPPVDRYGIEEPAAASRLVTRSSRMDRQIRGVTVGDIDGDGANEIVCIDRRSVWIYRITEGRLVKIADMQSGVANIAVDAADLNGNGRWELFITQFNDETLRSYVLEWEGSGLRRIADKLRWYFRAIDSAGGGRMLVGQRKGMEGLFLTGIFRMGYGDGGYHEVQKLQLPGDRNIFGFTRGAVRSAEAVDIIDYSRDHYLRITDSKGREEWSSQESCGGSDNALVTHSPGDRNEAKIRYLPSRVHVVDLDGDGIQEVIAAKNEDRAGVFSRLRIFKQGRLEVLKWDSMGLVPVWRTPSVTKFIGDFTVGDVDGDGGWEIVAAVVQKRQKGIGSGSSYLAVFSPDHVTGAARP
jgi:hypothetical protein